MGGGGCCIGDFSCCVGNHPFIDAIKDFFCSDSCCVGNAPGPTDSEIHVKKVADELAEIKEKNEESTSKQESNIIEYINRSMNSFINEVSEFNKQSYSGKSLSINTELLNKKNEELKGHVVGCIGNEMNKRLVQTDKELSTILAEKDDEVRRKNFDAFINKVKIQALNEFKKEVERTVKLQSDVVYKEINTRLLEINKSMGDSIDALTEIMDSKKKSDEELEKMQMKYMYQSSLCSLLLDEV